MRSREVCYANANQVTFGRLISRRLINSHDYENQQLIKEKRRALLEPNDDTADQSNNIVKQIKLNYGVQDENDDTPTRKIFIDHVLCNETKFNDSEVRDHVYTIVAAGSETTALQTAHTSEKFHEIFEAFLTFLFFLHNQSCSLRPTQKFKRKLPKSWRKFSTPMTLKWTTTISRNLIC